MSGLVACIVLEVLIRWAGPTKATRSIPILVAAEATTLNALLRNTPPPRP
jgi:hypothetical protein